MKDMVEDLDFWIDMWMVGGLGDLSVISWHSKDSHGAILATFQAECQGLHFLSVSEVCF